MKKRTAGLLFLLIVCFILCAGCNANGGLVNPMADVHLSMNVPITKAPNSFIDPKVAPTPTPEANTTLAEGEFKITPTSTYVFRYE